MEAFSLLKYWKGTGAPAPPSAASDATTAVLAAVAENDYETTDDDDGGDDGPFFDLEFEEEEDEEGEEEEDDDCADSEGEFNLTLSPSTNEDPNLPLSPSEDLFFKGKLLNLEPLSNASEPNSKPQFTASLFKSATKFRVFRLGLKKPKPNKDLKNPETEQKQRKLFTVKFKVEEAPIVSLFTRDNSSKGSKPSQKKKQQNGEESRVHSPSSVSDEKRFSKEAMQKYLKMVKPLYIKVSRKYTEKLRFSGQLNVSPPPQKAAPAEAEGSNSVKGQKQGTLPLHAGLRVVCKHLGKSRSASATTPAAPAADSGSSRRRDDSLLQQEDGIQSAILHCKRSFNAPRECESSQLPISVSDPLHEVSPELSRKSTNEGK